MQPGSGIGFALVFLVTSWATSLVIGAAALVSASWLRRLGPEAERRALSLAIVAGPFAGLALSGALAFRSAATAWFGWEDHCLADWHHAHLCWFHGGTWADAAWAIALLGAVAVFVLVRGGAFVVDVVRARRALRRIARMSTEIEPGVFLAPGDTGFCFVAGDNVYVSSAAWNALADDERRAVLAHERAHVASGDLRFRVLLGLVSIFVAPFVAGRLLRHWRRATEKVCDRAAARTIGEVAPVARALVAMARVVGPAPAIGAAFLDEQPEVVERVETLLADGPDGRAAARRIAGVAFAWHAATAVAAVIAADPLHHAIESFLGGF